MTRLTTNHTKYAQICPNVQAIAKGLPKKLVPSADEDTVMELLPVAALMQWNGSRRCRDLLLGKFTSMLL